MGKKALIIIAMLVGVVLLIGFITAAWGLSVYNGCISKEEAVKSAWSQVENVYQRRTDLIPNLVETVKGYARQESNVLIQVTEARAKVSQMKISDDIISDPQKFQQFQQAQGELSSALTKLMVVVENYPDLKSNVNFLALQSQLEGTENRITVERKRFNEEAQGYNTHIKKVPNNIVAGFGSFKPKEYFRMEAGADKVPKVDFSK